MFTTAATTLKNIFIYCFDKWWRPLLFFFFIVLLLMLNDEFKIRFLRKPLQFLSNVSVWVLLISFVYQLFKKRFLKAAITIFIVLVVGVISFMIGMIDGDHWADDLEIPAGIQLAEPVGGRHGGFDEHSRDSVLNYNRTEPDLVLYHSFQPGMYRYDFWTGRIEDGAIYLKAFEITQDDKLSPKSLRSQTAIPVYNKTDSLVRFGAEQDFTIYEGDWGKFYAARFEVWFVPAMGGNERKLFEKNFKVEGWMH